MNCVAFELWTQVINGWHCSTRSHKANKMMIKLHHVVQRNITKTNKHNGERKLSGLYNIIIISGHLFSIWPSALMTRMCFLCWFWFRCKDCNHSENAWAFHNIKYKSFLCFMFILDIQLDYLQMICIRVEFFCIIIILY